MTLKKSDSSFLNKAKLLVNTLSLGESTFKVMEEGSVYDDLDKEIKEAITLGIKETPSIYINGYYLPKIPEDENLFVELIVKALGK